jgi:hypothetical protein
MLIGVAFYSMVIGITSAFFTSKDTKDSLLRGRISMVEEFCKNLNINPDLEKKLRNSIIYGSDKLAYLWLTDEADIFRELNVQLKYEFLRAIHTNLITNCNFFRDKDISFVVRVVPLLKPMQVPAGEQLWLPGDYSSSCNISIL